MSDGMELNEEAVRMATSATRERTKNALVQDEHDALVLDAIKSYFRFLPPPTPSRESSDELASLAAKYLGMSDGEFAEKYGAQLGDPIWALFADCKSLAGSVVSQARGDK